MVALGDQLHLFTPHGRYLVQRVDPLAIAPAEDEAGDVLTAPMPGRIVRQLIAAGDRVGRGAPLLVLEAMKMEHTIVAPGDGRIAALRYAEGDQVDEGAVLLDFEAIHETPQVGVALTGAQGRILCGELALGTGAGDYQAQPVAGGALRARPQLYCIAAERLELLHRTLTVL